jgi:hypothetical protein
MAQKEDLQEWVLEALKAHNGSASIIQISKFIWENHEKELRQSGNLFYTWQYDVRWAAKDLRDQKLIRPAEQSPKGIWELT